MNLQLLKNIYILYKVVVLKLYFKEIIKNSINWNKKIILVKLDFLQDYQEKHQLEVLIIQV